MTELSFNVLCGLCQLIYVCSENNEGSSFNENTSSILKFVQRTRLNVGIVQSEEKKTAFSTLTFSVANKCGHRPESAGA